MLRQPLILSFERQAMHRARLTASILGILLALLVIPFLVRRGQVDAARDDSPRSGSVAPADAAPAASASADTDDPAQRPRNSAAALDPSSPEIIGTLTAAHYFQTYLNVGFL